MGRGGLLLLFGFLLWGMSAALAERENKSALGTIYWSTADDENDLLANSDAEEGTVKDEKDEFQGGFSTLDSMLQWAVGHSDPEKLKGTAQDIQRMSASELAKRQQEIKELMEKMKMPSDAELMKIAIAGLNNASISLDECLRALNELLILVEPIDNANDLNKLGGLDAVIQQLNSSEPEIRTTSAWVLGKASQNNPVVQNQILELGALVKLMKMVKSSFTEEAIKALYAVSAIISNNVDGQDVFLAESGFLMLQDIMSNSSKDIRLLRKSVFLVTDLADYHLQNTNLQVHPFFGNHQFLKSVVDLISSADLDLQEKALLATKSLLQLTTTEALVFKDYCDLGGALAKMRKQLERLIAEEHQGDFAKDMEALRKEVEYVYHEKLEEASWVPT